MMIASLASTSFALDGGGNLESKRDLSLPCGIFTRTHVVMITKSKKEQQRIK